MTTEKQELAAQARAWRMEDPDNRTVQQACEQFGVGLHSYYAEQKKTNAGKGKPKKKKATPPVVKSEALPTLLSKPTSLNLAPPKPAASMILSGKTIVIVTDTADLMTALGGLGFGR